MEWTIEACKNPSREYWVIKDTKGHIVWMERTKEQCLRVINDGTLKRAIDEWEGMCYNINVDRIC